MAVHRIAKGLDLPLAGAPVQRIDDAAPVRQVALVASDYHGLKPSLRVREGDSVLRGQLLCEDNAIPGVRHTSPAAGTVAAIHRGDRRALRSIVVELDPRERSTPLSDSEDLQVRFEAWTGEGVPSLGTDAIRALLVESGLWTALRTRPFSRVPSPTATPRSIFVTALDSHPHAPDPPVVLAGREQDFRDGVSALLKLTAGKVFVCVAEGAKVDMPDDPRVRVEEFHGPHPAGTPGLHIHLLDPVDLERAVWHIGYQDVVAVGHLLRTGRLEVGRVVALAGPAALRPRLLRTRAGASLGDLTAGETEPGEPRLVSGSVLGGRTAMGPVDGFLGRYDQQVSVLPEGRERRMFGYIAPGADRFSIWRVVLGALGSRPLRLDTSTNGGARAMVPIGSYERVMPMDLMPTFLLRALITGDVERAEALGCLELDEEDLALCTFVCPGKTEYGPLLRSTLTHIERGH